MSIGCETAGNEPHLLGHKSIHLAFRGFGKIFDSGHGPEEPDAGARRSAHDLGDHARRDFGEADSKGDAKGVAYYQKLIATTAAVIPFEEKAALAWARPRADRSLRPPDTIQLACAVAARTDLFITNDARLHSKQIPGIQFIVPLDRIPI